MFVVLKFLCLFFPLAFTPRIHSVALFYNLPAPYNQMSASTSNVIIVDDADSAVKYSSGWAKISDQLDYKQSSSAPTSPGATAQLDFTGSSIKVMGTALGASGLTQQFSFSVDGATPSNTSTPGNGTGTHGYTFFSQNGLSDGNHSLLVTYLSDLGGQNMSSIDYFLYEQSASTKTDNDSLYFVGMSDPRVQHSALWNSTAQTTSSQTIGGTDLVTNGTAVQLNFTFTGTSISLYGGYWIGNIIAFSQGEALNASISIDGATPVNKPDLDRSKLGTPQYNQQIFASSQLEQKEHTLTLDLMNSTTPFFLDYFLVSPGPSTSNSDPPVKKSDKKVIAIAVPLSIVIMLVAGFLLFFWRRRRTRRRTPLDLTSGEESGSAAMAQTGSSPLLTRTTTPPSPVQQQQQASSSSTSPVSPSSVQGQEPLQPTDSHDDSGVRFHDTSPEAVRASQVAAMDKVQRIRPPPAYTED